MAAEDRATRLADFADVLDALGALSSSGFVRLTADTAGNPKYELSGALCARFYRGNYIGEMSPLQRRWDLTGEQARDLTEAFLDAFPDEDALRRMVHFGLDESLDRIPGGRTLTDKVFYLIQWARAQGRTEELVVKARSQVPGNPRLRSFAERFGLATTIPMGTDLERIVLKSVRFADVEQWRTAMGECELPVCRVEFGGEGIGTGFLVGSDLAMTCCHVVEDVIRHQDSKGKLGLRFEYKRTADGKTVQKGIEYKLASDWLVGWSAANELDYALLRVEGSPGKHTVAGMEGAPQRGWLTPESHAFEAGEPLVVLQHPNAGPLQLAIGSVTAVRGARIAHTTNTLGGSSGSPGFSAGWRLVALHRAGLSTSNEAVALGAILDDLERWGLSRMFAPYVR